MSRSYKEIPPEISRRLKLLMADIDGTLNTGGDQLSPTVCEAVQGLKQTGLMLGLVSGRTDAEVRAMALKLELDGPVIAENGAVARLSVGSDLVDLGYSRRPAANALARLKAAYPGRITEREDNSERVIDLVFRAQGIGMDELKTRAGDVQVLDSTYIFHLMQKGIDKGRTLRSLLDKLNGSRISAENVLVIGDSMTDLPLFQSFPVSVLVPNPVIPGLDKEVLRKAAAYVTDSEAGAGFAELAFYIISQRTLSPRG